MVCLAWPGGKSQIRMRGTHFLFCLHLHTSLPKQSFFWFFSVLILPGRVLMAMNGEDNLGFMYHYPSPSTMLCFESMSHVAADSAVLASASSSNNSSSSSSITKSKRKQPNVEERGNRKKTKTTVKGKDKDNTTTTTTTKPKARKEKLGDRITALQQLVSPFGKTDTASVLHEAMGYIRFLHDQVQVLSSPYLQTPPSSAHFFQDGIRGEEEEGDKGRRSCDLRSRGLCLVPVECTAQVASSNGADFWSSSYSKH